MSDKNIEAELKYLQKAAIAELRQVGEFIDREFMTLAGTHLSKYKNIERQYNFLSGKLFPDRMERAYVNIMKTGYYPLAQRKSSE
ncbi:MAG: hypothetical protein OEL87_03025 [Nanoarchaeota archaeon]|nr:hypothetical protein [Nanoarchaeota archaeon]